MKIENGELKTTKTITRTSGEFTVDAVAYPYANPQSKVVAAASVSVNGMFAVKHMQIVDGEKGLFARMPQYKTNDGSWKDICFPLSGELRKLVNDAAVEAYREAVVERPTTSVVEQIRESQTAQAEPQTARKQSNPSADVEIT